jgi:Tol biopolymer transport system component
VDVSGNREPTRYDLAGLGARQPSTSPAGDRLAFQRIAYDRHIRRYQAGEDPRLFLASSAIEYGAQFSPDGRRVAFCSGRTGDRVEVWVADADGTQPVQLTSGPGHGQCSPQWSPDGRLIAFDSQNAQGRSEIFVIDAGGGRPKLLSSAGTFDDALPTWSRDGRWIYIMSRRSGRMEIWRIPSGGGQAQQITQNGGFLAIESTDGKTLFYSYQSKVFARQLADGSERQVLDSATDFSYAPVEDGIFYIGLRGPDGGHFPLEFYDFATGTSRLLTYLEGAFEIGFSVSPDRKTILYGSTVHSVYDLMMIENFR